MQEAAKVVRWSTPTELTMSPTTVHALPIITITDKLHAQRA